MLLHRIHLKKASARSGGAGDRARFTRFIPMPSASAPIADGGEGTVDALVAATGGRKVSVTATGPLGNGWRRFTASAATARRR